MTRLWTVLLSSFLCLVGLSFAAQAEPLGPTTVLDSDDVRRRLDIRSVSVDTLREDRTRVTLVFWNGVRPRFLRRHAARIEPEGYVIRFWPGPRQLRVTWGDPASTCCISHRAHHPDPFTYTTVIFLDGVQPTPTRVRAETTGMLDCTHGSTCGTSGGSIVDRTRWGDL